jgi:hypothetical protein
MPSELNTRNTSTTDNLLSDLFPPESSNELSHFPNLPNFLLSNTAAIYTLQPSIKVSDIEYFYPNMPSSWTDIMSSSAFLQFSAFLQSSAFLQPFLEIPERRPEIAKTPKILYLIWKRKRKFISRKSIRKISP